MPSVDLGALAGGRLAFVVDNDLFVADALQRGDPADHRRGSGQRGVERELVPRRRVGGVRRSTTRTASGSCDATGASAIGCPGGRQHVHVVADERRARLRPGRRGAARPGRRHVAGARGEPPAGRRTRTWCGRPMATASPSPGRSATWPSGRSRDDPDAGWNSGVQPPVRGVVAWPRDDHLIVQERSAGTLLSFDPGTGQSTPLADGRPHVHRGERRRHRPGRNADGGSDRGRDLVCPLDQGAAAPCIARGEPGIGLSSPRFVPGTNDLSVIFTSEADGAADPGDSTETTAPTGIAPGGRRSSSASRSPPTAPTGPGSSRVFSITPTGAPSTWVASATASSRSPRSPSMVGSWCGSTRVASSP